MKRFLFRPLATAVFTCLLLCTFSRGAETVHLTLTMDGSVIEGESSQLSLGRANTIECVSWESEFFRPAGNSGTVHRPVKIVKRIDKSTPLLAKAFENSQTGTASFKFYRPNPNGDGTTEQFFTVVLDGVRITSERILVPSTITNTTATSPPLDEVTFSYTSMRIIYTNGGVETELRVR
jgi:type VI secretion system secreted protein Hcp